MKQRFTQESNEDEKIVLDKATFRALASDTRIDLLKELDQRRKTLTELAEALGLAVATVKEHMAQLSQSKLVLLKDEGRKWKYYELTEKGKAVLYPERKKIWVMLASLAFMILLSTFMSYHDMGYLGGSASPLESARLMALPNVASDAENNAVAASTMKRSVVEEDTVMDESEPELIALDAERFGATEEPLEEDIALDIQYQEVDPRPYLRYSAYAVTLGLALAVMIVVIQHHFHRTKKQKSKK
jgi:DNA-binding transcriptional ArsR family regulator